MKLRMDCDTRPRNGAMLHKCSVCGRVDEWGETWEWFGSWKNFEAGKPITKVCGEACKALLPPPKGTR